MTHRLYLPALGRNLSQGFFSENGYPEMVGSLLGSLVKANYKGVRHMGETNTKECFRGSPFSETPSTTQKPKTMTLQPRGQMSRNQN